jgi:hypothetical protein
MEPETTDRIKAQATPAETKETTAGKVIIKRRVQPCVTAAKLTKRRRA